MRNPIKKMLTLSTCLLMISAGCLADEKPVLEGTWRLLNYLNSGDQVRYQTEGYMMFGKAHWLHLAFFNRDERPQDFSEAHHGTYEITGPDSLELNVDIDLHMDPKTEFQDSPVWYGGLDHIKNAQYRAEDGQMIIDLPSGAQLVLQKLE
jgi:hypothetical protein